MSFFKSSSKASKASPCSPPVDDAASFVSSAPSEITLIKEQNKAATEASSSPRNPSATKADPNRSWEARSYALGLH